MENASKALIMAGGVLLAMLLLSLGTYLFKNMGVSSSNVYSKLEESDITEFNQQFLNYDDRGTYVTGQDEEGNDIYNNPLNIQDVVTIINIAKDNNDGEKMPVKVVVKLDGTEVQGKTESEINEMLKQDLQGTSQLYSCEVNISSTSKLVDEVIIKSL